MTVHYLQAQDQRIAKMPSVNFDQYAPEGNERYTLGLVQKYHLGLVISLSPSTHKVRYQRGDLVY